MDSEETSKGNELTFKGNCFTSVSSELCTIWESRLFLEMSSVWFGVLQNKEHCWNIKSIWFGYMGHRRRKKKAKTSDLQLYVCLLRHLLDSFLTRINTIYFGEHNKTWNVEHFTWKHSSDNHRDLIFNFEHAVAKCIEEGWAGNCQLMHLPFHSKVACCTCCECYTLVTIRWVELNKN